MVLELKKNGGGVNSLNPNDCVVPRAVLEKIWGRNPPTITYVSIDGNTVTMNLGQAGFSSFSGADIPVLKGDLPLRVSYFQSTRENPSLRVEFIDSEKASGTEGKMSYDIIFTSSRGFHGLATNLLDRNSLGAYGLDFGENFEGNLEYHTPFVVWRGLPKTLLDNVTSFDFHGPVFHLSLGNSRQYSSDPPDILTYGIDNPHREGMKPVADRFKQTLVSTGLVRHVNETGHGGRGEFFEIIDLNRIRQPQSLCVLEEIARQVPDGVELRRGPNGAEIKISGVTLPTAIFGEVPEVFDGASNDMDFSVSGKVGRLGISKSRSYSSAGTSSWTIHESSLEEAQRLILASRNHLYGSSIGLLDESGNGLKRYSLVDGPK